MSTHLIDEANNRLDEFEKKSSKLTEKIINGAKEISKLDSKVIFGIIGGALSIPLSSLIALAPIFSFPVISGPVMLIGISCGVIVARGLRFFKNERIITQRNQSLKGDLEANRIVVDEVLERIKSLPSDAPPEAKQVLWENFIKLNSSESMIPVLKPIDSGDKQKYLTSGNKSNEQENKEE